MKRLNEKEIIKIINSKHVSSEDVEIFNLGNKQCAVCVDTLVESTDIPKGSKLSDISRKSIVSSVSDFAAKGIIPKFCIISVTLPKTISKKQVQELSKGFLKACKEFKIQLLGGDTNQGTEISIHVVLFGNVKKYTKRQGAKIGDIICTTGAFGYTAAALDIILKKKKATKAFSTKSKNLFFKPKARLEFGHKIPTNKDVIEFSNKNNTSLNRLVFDGGEEFELVFTVMPRDLKKIHALAKKSKISIFEIGYVSKGKGVFFDDGNSSFKIEDNGWQHFR